MVRNPLKIEASRITETTQSCTDHHDIHSNFASTCTSICTYYTEICHEGQSIFTHGCPQILMRICMQIVTHT